MTQDESKSSLSARDATDMIINFHVAIKLAKVYASNNRQFQERLQILFSAIQKLHETEDLIQIRVIESFVFVNRLRLKFSFAHYPIYQFILNEFNRWQIGMLSFLSGLTKEELRDFIILLTQRDLPKENPFEHLAEDFKAGALPHIRMQKNPTMIPAESRDRNAAPMYFLGIYHLKQVFHVEQGVLNLRVTKRWIQTICKILSFDESVLFGLTSIKNFEDYTLNHSVNVCVLALALGRRLGLSRPELIDLGISACLHDVGKYDIPQEILNKPSILDARERGIIEKHAPRGAVRLIQMRAAQQIPTAAILVALEHHITPQLAGYPKYVWKTQTALFSRIVKIIDYYDAITTKRVYRPKTLTPAEALKLMVEQGIKEFDPLILKAFIQMIGVYPIGSLVILDSGEMAIVAEINPQAAFIKRPKVKLITDAKGIQMDGPIFDLAEMDEAQNKFKKSILTTLDPEKYGIRIYDYLLAMYPAAAATADPGDSGRQDGFGGDRDRRP